MDYEVVPYRPDLDSQIVRLQTHLWSPDPACNAAYLKWKYVDNPFFNETLISLVLCGGRVVGMRGMFGTLWEVDRGAARHPLPYADDFVVAPEHRNRGVVSRIMKASLDDAAGRGFPFAVSLSAGPVTFMSSLAAGWRSAGSYQSVWRGWTASPLAERVRRLARQTRWSWRFNARQWYWRVNAALRALWPRGLFDRLDREARRSSGPVSLSCEARPEQMAALIARLPWDGRIRHVRTPEYFAWRFRNPLQEYRFLFYDNGGLQGYVVLQRYRRSADPGCVNIADWEASNEGTRVALLEAALRWGSFPRIHTWAVGMSDPLRALLQDYGFEASAPGDLEARSTGLLVRRLGDAFGGARWGLGSRDLLNITDWDLRMIYSMAA